MHVGVHYAAYGSPDVLELVEILEATPGVGEVRLSVRAAGVNPLEWKQRSGAVRDVMPVELPARPGLDVAGIVTAVGPSVSRVQVGDEVLGRALDGSYASTALAHESALAHKPSTLRWEVAASLPVAATTAAQILTVLDLGRGQTLVIHGASGAVGTLLVQLAARQGLSVIATAAPTSHDRLRAFGAVPTRYGPGLVDRILSLTHPDRPSAAVDVASVGDLEDLIAVVGTAERVLILADPAAFDLGAIFLGANDPEPATAPMSLEQLAELVADGSLAPVAVTTYPLTDAASAHRDGEARRLSGKAVLLP